MFCINCGAKLETNQSFCNKCGSPIKLTKDKEEPVYSSNPIKETNTTPKSSGKKNDILYCLGYWFVNWVLMSSKEGIVYSLGFTFVPFIILLISTGIPNKALRRIVLLFISAFFFIITIAELQDMSY